MKLRTKKLKGSHSPLYLDIYPPILNPKTRKLVRKHYLSIYVYNNPVGKLQVNHNRETLELANYICAQRQLDIQNRRYDFVSDSHKDENFITFFEEIRDKNERYSKSRWIRWDRAIGYLKAFAGDMLSFRNINENFCEEYASYLLTSPILGRRRISLNTASAYFARFRLAIRKAYKKKFFSENLYELIEPIKQDETIREFLYQDELQRLADTPCRYLIVKKACLFSALTGLRYSDISKLTWNQISGSKGDYYLRFRQEKTGRIEHLPVSNIAIELLGARPVDENNCVFVGLSYSLVVTELKVWVPNASILKHITFHSFRHTFATLQLAAGTDIVTLSKLLGHKRLDTTMIYVKVVDSLKKKAVGRLTLIIR